MQIELYIWQGKWGPFRIASDCEECDVNLAILRELQKKFADKIKLVVQPWLDNWAKLFFRHGAWHAPIVVIDGKLYAQGVIVEGEKIRALL